MNNKKHAFIKINSINHVGVYINYVGVYINYVGIYINPDVVYKNADGIYRLFPHELKISPLYIRTSN